MSYPRYGGAIGFASDFFDGEDINPIIVAGLIVSLATEGGTQTNNNTQGPIVYRTLKVTWTNGNTNTGTTTSASAGVLAYVNYQNQTPVPSGISLTGSTWKYGGVEVASGPFGLSGDGVWWFPPQQTLELVFEYASFNGTNYNSDGSWALYVNGNATPVLSASGIPYAGSYYVSGPLPWTGVAFAPGGLSTSFYIRDVPTQWPGYGQAYVNPAYMAFAKTSPYLLETPVSWPNSTRTWSGGAGDSTILAAGNWADAPTTGLNTPFSFAGLNWETEGDCQIGPISSIGAGLLTEVFNNSVPWAGAGGNLNMMIGSGGPYMLSTVSPANLNPPTPPPPPPSPPSPALPAVITPPQTLLLDLKAKRWFADAYPAGVTVRVWEPGAGVHDQVLGHFDGTVDTFAGQRDQNHQIPYVFQPGDVDVGVPRQNKTFGDFFISANPAGGNGFTVVPGYNDYETTLPAVAKGAGVSGRTPFVIDINTGLGVIARNFGMVVSGADADVVPIFDLWEPAYIPKVEDTFQRATDWDDAGYLGCKWVQGVIIEADTGGVPRIVHVEYDGGAYSELFAIDDTNQSQIPYSFVTPLTAHMLRIVPTDGASWRFYRARWVFEIMPEAVSVWAPQPTTHDLMGYQQLERVLMAYMSTVAATLTIQTEVGTASYNLPSTSGIYQKTNVILAPNKGMVYDYNLATIDGSSSLRVFQRDIEVRCRGWGSNQPYATVRPFGDVSREQGARI